MLEDHLEIELRGVLDGADVGLETGSLPKAEERSVNTPAVRRKRMFLTFRSAGEKQYERLILTRDYDNNKKKPHHK